MGLIYTSKDFDCVEYLENFALNKLKKRFNLSVNRGLDILAKSLLYDSYRNLLKDIKNVKDEYESRNGCFFSEFVLAEELSIEIKDAYSLKKELDNHHFHGSGISHGNIEVANLTDVNTYSYNISLGKETRLMFSYPIDFYTRIYNQSFRLDCGNEYSIEALWCDGFNFLHPSYFSTHENMELYIESIFESLLSFNHLVFSYSYYNLLAKHDPVTHEFVENNFEKYPVYNEILENRPYGIYIPHESKSLRKRLGFKGASLPINSSDSIVSNVELIDRGDVFKEARERQGMTKTRLADLSGISVRTIYNVENEVCSHHSYTIRKLASVLQLDISNWFSSTR